MVPIIIIIFYSPFNVQSLEGGGVCVRTVKLNMKQVSSCP